MARKSDIFNLMRDEASKGERKVAFTELFYDLVFVFALTQVSAAAYQQATWIGLAEAFFLFLALWWIWIHTAWVTNWLDPHKALVRLMLFVLMGAGLILAISVPRAFYDLGLLFAGAYVFIQIGRSLFMSWALYRQRPENYRNYRRVTAWMVFSGIFWIAGGLTSDGWRYGLWGAALLIEYSGPALNFRTPRLGRSEATDWDISGEHMAERCGLFVIIALGESLLATGHSFSDLGFEPLSIAAFATAVVGAIAMWWVYFDVGAQRAARKISETGDPSGVARMAYTYEHILIVWGIIAVAVADKIILARPGGPTRLMDALVIVGGPLSFIVGNYIFKRSVLKLRAASHLVGAAVLAVLFGLYWLIAPLHLAILATTVMILVAAWENVTVKGPHEGESLHRSHFDD